MPRPENLWTQPDWGKAVNAHFKFMTRDAYIQANGLAFDCSVEIINPEPKVGVPVKFTFRLLETEGVPLDVAVEAAQLNPDGMEGTKNSIWLNSRKEGYRFKSNPESSSEFLATSLNINPDTGKPGFTK